MRIRTETLDMCCDEQCPYATPLQVQLLLHVTRVPAVETTAYSLIVNISKTCCKRFEFFPGAQIQIPTSTRLQTAVTIELRQEDISDSIVMKHALVDVLKQKTSETPETILLPQASQDFLVCTNITSSHGSVLWKFPCVAYRRDAEEMQEDYNMQNLGNDFGKLQQEAQLLPVDTKFTIVSAAEAQQRIGNGLPTTTVTTTTPARDFAEKGNAHDDDAVSDDDEDSVQGR